ncbi:SIR2 family protein [Mucilaginibacter sp. cycad4]|uniref:SIR2 family protein n=1 Tax=Mucilaginibacter sp. cycad4 TaxID=3342096 RepID=UPI002AAC29ED|nr:SIR2 family protein [Mucilaginibacter gossypii]WPU99906.1 SIR2 family protein [Mucilaginibacter gossypii]
MALLKRQKYKLVDILSKIYPTLEEVVRVIRDVRSKDIDIEGASSKRWNNIVEFIKDKDDFSSTLNAISFDLTQSKPESDKDRKNFEELKTEIYAQTPELLLNHLRDIINTRQCVLFLGPNAFKCIQRDRIVPFSDYLAGKFVAELNRMDIFCEPVAVNELSYLIDRYESREAASLADTKAFAAKWYREATPYIPFYEKLESLNFPVVINTNPEILFGRRANTERFVHLRYDKSNAQAQALPADYSGKTIVYNIYGSFDNEHSVLFTEKEAVAFTKGAYEKNPPILQEVRTQVMQSYGLFVGFDFHDWHLKILFDVLDLRNKPGNYSVYDGEIAEQHLEYYSRQFNMTFYTEDDLLMDL